MRIDNSNKMKKAHANLYASRRALIAPEISCFLAVAIAASSAEASAKAPAPPS